MFVILDEECLRPGAEDDKRVVIHMDKTFKNSPYYLSNGNSKAKNLRIHEEFQVSHNTVDLLKPLVIQNVGTMILC